MPGIQSHSADIAGQRYVIFAVDDTDAFNAFLAGARLPASLGGGSGSTLEYKELRGSYDGEEETSYIVAERDWPHFRPFAAYQESILVLGPITDARRRRPATLHFLDGRLPVYLGYLTEVSEREARSRNAWTYDPTTNLWYVCRK